MSLKQINLILEVREEERVTAVVRAFIDTDEYQGYVEDVEVRPTTIYMYNMYVLELKCGNGSMCGG